MLVLRSRTVKSVKHYLVLGAYLGGVAFIIAIVKALPAFPEKLLESAQMPWWDIPLGLLGIVAFFAALLLCGAGIAGFVGWLQLNAEKRARARQESLIVRR